jgi:phosphatidylglycerophosphate synthase
MPHGDVPNFDRIHKLPAGRRYFNVSVLWIFYYTLAIRLLYRLRIRHEAVTLASIGSGLTAAWLIVRATTMSGLLWAALLVHLKDLFDACDGALARLTGTGHRLGRFLDTIGDGVVFTAWIVAAGWRMAASGTTWPACLWAVAAWLSLFLQCSYFNFYQLHYIAHSGAESTSRLDERSSNVGSSVVRGLSMVYELWFGWQDRLIALWDRWQRNSLGMPQSSAAVECDRWFSDRRFMIANSALCFGTHAFVLILCLVLGRPASFLPAVAVGMNLYFAGIILARQWVYRRA